MQNVTQLIADQLKIGSQIEDKYTNFKKDSVSRKTRDYCNRRLVQINELDALFEKNHKQLLENFSEYSEHEYFRENYFDNVNKVVDKYREHLNALLSDDAKNVALEKAKADLAKTTAAMAEFAREIENDHPELVPTAATSTETLAIQQEAISLLNHLLSAVKAEPASNWSKIYIRHKLDTIEHHYNDIRQTHLELSCNSSYETEAFHTLTDDFHAVVIMLKESLAAFHPGNTGNSDMDIKLPKITLPVFDGNYLMWKPFQDLYTQVIHNRAIAPSQKFFYLRANLTGEPHNLIKHLQATDINYATAWELLTDRYDNPRLLVTAQLNQLMSLPTLQVESANGIKKMHDTSVECIQAISNLGVATDNWDPIILHTLLQKLDKDTRRLYEQSLTAPRSLQCLNEFFKFLECRFQTLETCYTKEDKRKHSSFVSYPQNAYVSSCAGCKSKGHHIFQCKDFLKLSVDERIKRVKLLQLCLNCLKHGHNCGTCPSRNCVKCNKKHNSLLHLQKINVEKSSESHVPARPSALKASTSETSSEFQVLLATAIVNVRTSSGTQLPGRVLLDTGSQLHFISSRFAHELGVERQKTDMRIAGIGANETKVNFMTSVTISSTATEFSSTLNAIILNKISGYQPRSPINISNWKLPRGIELADPSFYKSNSIDMLLGADVCFELFEEGKITLSPELPILQNTKLGWIVAGKVTMPNVKQVQCCNIATQSQPSISQLEKQVKRFWEIEHFETPSKQMTQDEFRCEQHFSEHVTRNKDGTFVVKLPFKEDPSLLGSSKDMARKRLESTEKRLAKNVDLRNQYTEFLNEYSTLKHMEIVENRDSASKNYYLPHHCVCKPDSTSTKLRVVFDGSAKTTSGKSLNQILLVGPTVQPDLFSILIRFRTHQFVFTADISKMYRQILVAPEDRKYQCILWRPNTNEEVRTYQLNTVTYGTSSAPFLATRCLNELADREAQTFPEAARILKSDMYVDDCLSGSDSPEDAERLLFQLTKLLAQGNFQLRKFCSNNLKILRNIPNEHREKLFTFQQNEAVKTLGLIWVPQEDIFRFNALETSRSRMTKRTVLSDLAKLFDPLGLIGPAIVLGKLLLQELWKRGVDWDANVPSDLEKQWTSLMNQFSDLSSCCIPRCTLLPAASVIELHAFSDSSEVAYGACFYLRSIDAFGQIKTSLLCSKSRIAPLKVTTIAKLELCAALLMAEVVERLLQTLSINIEQVVYYTDSSTVLAWLSSPSYTWNTYIGNRVARIQELSRIQQWRHVSGSHNPADILSRGSFVKNLVQSTMWFDGPEFLRSHEIITPSSYKPPDEMPERRSTRIVLVTTRGSEEYTSLIDSINHKNSFFYLQKLIAYIFRFTNNCRCPKGMRTAGQLTISELEFGLLGLVRNVQRSSFSNQYKHLSLNKQLDSKEHLSSLSLYLDKNSDVIRVGGRLQNSNLPAASKNQILLPKNHIFSKLILEDLHNKHLHVAPQALVAISRERFWILDAKRMATSIVHKCMRCFKAKPRNIHQLMGQLPADRVTPARPFSIVGVDYCGPITIHYKIRGKRPAKAYVSIFVCFTTRAVHLELVSDLTSVAFLNALKRFIARRGVCSKIYSDNATNFVGARSELRELNELHHSQQFEQSVINFCQQQQIEWHHIPPRAPHFGGLWEAAVKSAKYHLVRFIAEASLTSEELQTVIAQIEAILNSRPITPMSSDPNDLEALTPGHFLIGAPLTTIAEPEIATDTNCLTRYRRIQLIQQQFWKRWSAEYLNLLQSKRKWRSVQNPIKPGDMVLIKEINLPPLRWRLGRVISAIPGRDNVVRVANVKTEKGTFTRAIHQLCPLPTEETAPDSKQETTHTKCNNRRVLRNGKSINLLSAAILVLLCMCTPAKSQPLDLITNAHITPFNDNIGMYFENVGNVKTVSSSWNIVIFYNLSTYWQELEGLEGYCSSMTKLCNRSELGDTYCKPFSKELTHRLEVISHKNDLLHKINSQKSRRIQRSPFDIVGSIANGLFGVLDQDYAKSMEEEIQRINRNEKNLLQLIKKQTSITDSTVNILKKSTTDINNQFKLIHKDLSKIWNYVQNDSQINHLNLHFNSLSAYVILILTNYEDAQRNLLDVILDLHHNKINPHLISPDQLQLQLSIIRNNIPSTFTLPSTNLLQFYKFITVKTRIVENAILFKMEIPLLANEHFQLFNIIPVPITQGNRSFITKRTSKFLAVTLLRDNYYPVSESDLRDCAMMDSTTYMCNRNGPIFNRESSVSKCELSLLHHKRDLLTECPLQEYNSTELWVKLEAANTWIFYLKETREQTANLICNEAVRPLTLQGSGLLVLRPTCILKFHSMTLYTEEMRNNTMKLSFQPSSNISVWNIPQQDHQVIADSPNSILYASLLNDTASKIKNLTRQENTIELNAHDIHHYSISYFTIAIIAGIVLYYLWDKRRSSRPTPQPRSLFRVSSSL